MTRGRQVVELPRDDSTRSVPAPDDPQAGPGLQIGPDHHADVRMAEPYRTGFDLRTELRVLLGRVAWGDHHRRLAAHPVLSGLRRSVIRRWALAADEVELDPGDVLLREDRIGYWFFLVQEGTAELVKAGRKVGQLGPGDHVGDVAILGFGPQPALVRATTPMRVFVIERRAFFGLIYDQPVVQRRLLPDMAEGGFAAKVRELRAAATADWRRVARSWPQPAARTTPLSFTVVRPGRSVRSSGWPFPTLLLGQPSGPARPDEVAVRQPVPWPVRIGAGVVAVAVLVIAGFAYHPPMMVVTPLKPIDISQDVTVTGTPVHGVHGRYLLLPVRLDRPSAWSALLAVASRRRRFPIRGRAPSVSELAEVRRQDEELFRQAQQEAAVAGARAAGIDVHAGGDGARVVQLAGSGGSLALRPDDVITAVNGAAVHLGSDVERLVRGHQGAGASVLTVEREGRTVFVPVPLPSGRERQGRLPVVLETRHASFSLPFQVSFRSRPIGGPSGGLVYALLLADMLGSRDLAHGRTVAATGAVDSSGVVSAVGFVAEKGEAAAGSHAGDFFLPAVQAALVHQASLRPRGVLSVDEAVRALLDQP